MHRLIYKILKNNYFRLTAMLAINIILTSCSIFEPVPEKEIFPRFHKQIDSKPDLSSLNKLSLQGRLSYPKIGFELPVKTQEKLYSFEAKAIPVKKALKLFATAYNLNLLADNDVAGEVTVSFNDLAFEQSMTALLGSLGYYWEADNNLIRVKSWQTKLFNIDYIRLNRIGYSSSEAQVSSGSSSSGSGDSGGGGGDSQAGKISIKQENRVEFWDELEKQLKILVSEEGRLVMNKISGTVQVSDRHPRVKAIENYLADVNDAVHRQVDIQVKILEVTLNDDFSLGVDWTKIVDAGLRGTQTAFRISNIISSPVGVGAALSPTLSLSTFDVNNAGRNNVTSLINALEEQGEVQIVSQPHIRTLNNQSALIKVGTDRTFFRREQNTDNTTSGSNTTTTDVPQVVTEGIVLSITPQISKDGWVMMDVSPVVTRVSSVSEVRGSAGNIQSSAPNLDIRQTSSLVRAFNGETVVIGGLIQTQESRTNRGVPGLKDIPVAGKLFQGQYDNVTRKELIIFITPKLIDAK